MDKYEKDTYGEHVAGVYDDWYASYDEAMIETLAALAHGGRALELGIGTGRVALPLQRKGITVHGIDASPAMISRLRGKPGGENIQVTFGDFAEVAVEGQYALIYIVFNTFFGLLTQAEQVQCLGNVAQRLERDGVFVVEAFMPDLARYEAQQALRVVSIGEKEVRLNASQLDPISQVITSQQVTLSDQGVQVYPVKLRYVWPAEFDLMARLGGLQLKHRWGNWKQAAFDANSGKHISVYEHAS